MIKRKISVGFLVIFIAGVFLSFTSALTPGDVSACPGSADPLTTPGVYTLTTDISIEDDFCFYLDSDNITIDGQGHSITGTNSISTELWGIDGGSLAHYTNLTIKNVNLINWGDFGGEDISGGGAILIRANDSIISNVSISHSYYGIYISSAGGAYSNNILIANTTISASGTGNPSAGLIISASTINVTLIGSNISGYSSYVLGKDVLTVGEVFVINSTYDSESVINQNEWIGKLTRQWYFDINVTNISGAAINSANVSSFNVTGSLQRSSLTTSSGLLRQTLTSYYRIAGSNPFYYSNYTINISKTGYVTRTVSLNISVNTAYSATLLADTAPNITITSPINTTYTNASILINFTADDETAVSSRWFNNGSTNISYSSPMVVTALQGSNTFIFYANDTVNNVNSTNVTFFVDLSASSAIDVSPDSDLDLGSSGGGSTTLGTISLTDSQFKNGYTQGLNIFQRIKFSADNEVHYVGVISIGSDSAVINVSSDEQQATLSVGQSKEFEVTGDNYYDINVTLNSISGSTATIKVMAVHDLIPASNNQNAGSSGNSQSSNEAGQAADETPVVASKTGVVVLIGIILAIIVVAAGIVLFVQRKNKKQ